jgi:HK97 family phage portal protein
MIKFFEKTGKLNSKNKKIRDEIAQDSGFRTYFQNTPQPVWMSRNYNKFADEAYTKNVIAFKCISMVSKLVASIDWKLYELTDRKDYLLKHPILDLLNFPNPQTNGSLLFESLISYKLISGNSFMLAVTDGNGTPKELYTLRPDRVSLSTDKNGYVNSFIYSAGGKDIKYPVDKLTGKSLVMHYKNFHPLNDHFGLSPIEAAAYSIDQHNAAAKWNQALLQNGAKPSGALVVKPGADGSSGSLTEEQFARVKNQIEDQYSGAHNAGRPMLLEGGLDWKEMSLSPKDMDFLESKHMSAREIALAFGVPSQLLGIPGDTTYSNFAEARVALWEHTILPMLDDVCDALNRWLVPMFKKSENLYISYDKENISALQPNRDNLWARISSASFLSDEEKREILGFKKAETDIQPEPEIVIAPVQKPNEPNKLSTV